ncbi:RimJ/RimL family protein N-acetyltransferase [Rhizomicrobium palustre]|uniref:RimJ/RimL family protein N-acetyltransferase n=1 Tax=Rhizomicrobium palustre TaxID=189966 RepID=A0A846N2T6_9PROT|nr:GNAT family N-acetyltransferase [Rhizomicrobium palustre]NIK90248.1 RimJ/RimL family protein N-acetyltransferase [Rhizomicrobium palustre]
MPISEVKIPHIETPRLILRGPRPEDFAPMLAMWQDPEVLTYFHSTGFSREDVWGRYLRIFGMWAVMGFGFFVVEDKASGAFAGVAGVFDTKRELDPPVPEGMPEAGWVLARAFHGKGYGTECMQAVFAWADEALNGPEIFCIMNPENQGSIRVAEKCGFAPWYICEHGGHPTKVMRRAPHGKPVTVA